MDKDALLEVLGGRTLSQRLAIRAQFETLYSFDPLKCFESGALAIAGPSPISTPRRKGSSAALFSLSQFPLLASVGEGEAGLSGSGEGIASRQRNFPDAFSSGVRDSNVTGALIAAQLLQQPTVRAVDVPTVTISAGDFDTPRLSLSAPGPSAQSSAFRARVGANLRRLCRALLQRPDELDAEALYETISGRAQSDEQCVEEILCTRSNEELSLIKKTFVQSKCSAPLIFIILNSVCQYMYLLELG